MPHRPLHPLGPRRPLADAALHVMLGLGRSTQRWLRKLEQRSQATTAGSVNAAPKRH